MASNWVRASGIGHIREEPGIHVAGVVDEGVELEILHRRSAPLRVGQVGRDAPDFDSPLGGGTTEGLLLGIGHQAGNGEAEVGQVQGGGQTEARTGPGDQYASLGHGSRMILMAPSAFFWKTS